MCETGGARSATAAVSERRRELVEVASEMYTGPAINQNPLVWSFFPAVPVSACRSLVLEKRAHVGSRPRDAGWVVVCTLVRLN